MNAYWILNLVVSSEAIHNCKNNHINNCRWPQKSFISFLLSILCEINNCFHWQNKVEMMYEFLNTYPHTDPTIVPLATSCIVVALHFLSLETCSPCCEEAQIVLCGSPGNSQCQCVSCGSQPLKWPTMIPDLVSWPCSPLPH